MEHRIHGSANHFFVGSPICTSYSSQLHVLTVQSYEHKYYTVLLFSHKINLEILIPGPNRAQLWTESRFSNSSCGAPAVQTKSIYTCNDCAIRSKGSSPASSAHFLAAKPRPVLKVSQLFASPCVHTFSRNIGPLFSTFVLWW